MISRLAWRSAWRNPRRTGILVAAVSIGIAGCLLAVAINIGMVLQMVDTAIATELGHVQVHRSGWLREPGIERSFVLDAAIRESLRAEAKRTKAWAPRVRGEGLASSARASVGVRVVGIDRDAEPNVSLVPGSLVQGAFLPAAGKTFVGEALAKRLRVGVGQKLVVSVQNPGGDLSGRAFRVAGLFRTASTDFDENTLYLSIADAQDLFGLGDEISEIVLVAVERSQIDILRDSLVATLGDEFEAHSWEQLQPLLVVIVESFDLVAWTVYGAVFVAMAFGIANVLLMAVYERTRELGVMMALGMKRGRVVALMTAESLLVTMVGVVIGFGVSWAVLFWLQDGIDFGGYSESLRSLGAGTRIVPQLRSSDLVVPVVVALVVSLLASSWPALRAARSKPGDALRHV